ncbi:MAG: metal-dependent phosphohydrolase [Leptolyngbyaceae cyanobacterium CSU_1_4]|nr:metal-dependent phosphohydrolase [Leptolyngbyaceae cyanobacterium CSU_1_4]
MLEGSILQKLKASHELGQGDKRPLNFGVYYKNTLVALCHALEDAILEADYSPLVITAFQRGKWYLQEADRYRSIAERSPQVVIMASDDAGFAEHPTSQKETVALVALEDADPVAQEWHLIILSPDYTAMVLCQELTEADYGSAGFPQEDLERKFYGFWTFEPGLVLETVDLAIAHIGEYNPELHQQLTTHREAIAARIQQDDALCHQPTADHLGRTVSRVVDYLQENQQDLNHRIEPLDNNLTSNELQAFLRVAQLIDQTDLSNPMAAAEVASLAEAMGQLVDLPSWQLHRLRLAGLLHRIALLDKAENRLTAGTSIYQQVESPDMPLSCPLVPGVQVLRKMGRLRAIATILTHHTEAWDGSGQPAGLSGDEIPVEARILGLVACFQQRVAAYRATLPEEAIETLLTQALADCRAEASDRWDPKLIDVLTLLVKGLQQGMSLPIAMPKIAAGLWMLDSHSEEELLRYEESMVDLTLS